MGARSRLLLSLFPLYSWAIEFPIPGPTRSLDFVHDVKGISPRPTPPPAVPRGLERWKRAESASLVGWIAPDNTCGYVGGSLGAIKTCEVGQVCGAVPGTDIGTVVCLDSDSSGQLTAYGNCIESSQYSASCDNACRQDLNTLKCTQSAYPYCFPYSIPDLNVGFFSCDSISTTEFEVFLTTFVGQTEDRQWTALYDDGSSSLGPTLTGTGSGLPLPINEPTGTTSSPPVQTIDRDDDDDKGGSSNAGAIAGGVVGGLAVLALIGFGIFFFLRRKSKTEPHTEAQVPQAYVGGQPPVAAPMGQMQQPYGQPQYPPYQPVQPPLGPESDGLEAAGYFGSQVGVKKDSYITTPGSPNSTLPRYSVAGDTQASSGAPSPALGHVSPPPGSPQPQPQQQPQPPPTELWADNTPRQP